jgi:Glycosyl transferases group 1
MGDVAEAYQQFWATESEALAAKSSRGQFVLAETSTHRLHADAEDLVADRILRMLSSLRNSRNGECYRKKTDEKYRPERWDRDAPRLVVRRSRRDLSRRPCRVVRFRSVHVSVDHPQAHLVIAGKPYSPEFAEEVRERDRGLDRVHLALGYVQDADIQVYLRAADCFVAPYKYIQTCSAIYLALAFELPIVIKFEGNVLDFEPHEIGVFMRSPDEIESAMRRMLDMPPADLERLRANARAASLHFSWDRLRHLYRQGFDAFEAEHGGANIPPHATRPAESHRGPK